MHSYLLSFDQSRSERHDVVDAIDRIDAIANWIFFFDNTACLVSDCSAKELADLIQVQLPGARFIVTSLDRKARGGWLPRTVWNFIQDPKPVGR